MVDKERACLFHWAQSMIKYAEKYVLEGNLCDQHKAMCHQYRKATSLAEADCLHASIRAWWISSKAIFESEFQHLNQWLAFWHFQYLHWGEFMTKVLSIYYYPSFALSMFVTLLSFIMPLFFSSYVPPWSRGGTP